MRQERSNIVLAPGPTSAAQPPFMPAWDPGPPLPLGCWPWKQAHSPQTPVAQCRWLSCLGHLCARPWGLRTLGSCPCAPYPGHHPGSAGPEEESASQIQVLLAREVFLSDPQAFLYGRCSQIHESLVTAAAPQLPHNSCVTHSPRGTGGTGREIR